MRPDTVTLKGMRFHARIGVLPHEEQIPQPLEVDLTVEVSDARTVHVVDYTVLFDAVDSVVSGVHIGYLEDAAERIASAVLAVPGVATAHVAVRKPHVALRGPLAYAEVAITRPRG